MCQVSQICRVLFLGMVVPLVLHIWVLHNVLLLSEVAISIFTVQQWTTEDFTPPCNNLIFYSGKSEGNKGLIVYLIMCRLTSKQLSVVES